MDLPVEIAVLAVFAVFSLLFIAFLLYGPEGFARLLDFAGVWEPLKALLRQSDSVEYGRVKFSAEALVCAINAAATGNKNHACLVGFEKKQPSGEFLAPLGQFIAANPSLKVSALFPEMSGKKEEKEFVGSTSIVCKNRGKKINIDYYTVSVKDGQPDYADAFSEAVKYCKSRYAASYAHRTDTSKPWPQVGSAVESFSCEADEVSCTVTDFSMPQEVAKASEWIEGFGDPKYLIYHGKFPAGEDSSWAGMSPWFSGARTIIFATMCLSSILMGTWNLYGGAKAAVLHPVKTGARSISGVTAAMKWLMGIPKASLTVTDDAVWQVMRELSAPAAATATKQAMFQSIKSAAKSSLLSSAKFLTSWNTYKKIIPRTVGYTAINTIEAYYFSKWDTEFGKIVVEEPGKIVLLKALDIEAKKTYDTELETGAQTGIAKTALPIILDKGSDKVPLMLASPCHADLKVERKNVVCGSYAYNAKTKSVACGNPQVKESADVPVCSSNVRDFFKIRTTSGLGAAIGVWGTIGTKVEIPEDIDKINNLLNRGEKIKVAEKIGDKLSVINPLDGSVEYTVQKGDDNFRHGLDAIGKSVVIRFWRDDFLWIHCPGKKPIKITNNDIDENTDRKPEYGDGLYKSLIKNGWTNDCEIEYEEGGGDGDRKSDGTFNDKPPGIEDVYYKFVDNQWKWRNADHASYISFTENTAEYSQKHADKDEAYEKIGLNMRMINAGNSFKITEKYTLKGDTKTVWCKPYMIDNKEIEINKLTGTGDDKEESERVETDLVSCGDILLPLVIDKNMNLYEATFWQNNLYSTRLTVSDINRDGFADVFEVVGMAFGSGFIQGYEGKHYVILQDMDFDGKIDTMVLPECRTASIVVSAERGPYKDQEKHNFCYSTKYKWVDWATTIGMFATSAAAKAIPHPAVKVIAIATDCGLAAASTWLTEKDWPNS